MVRQGQRACQARSIKKELFGLQGELVTMQEWMRAEGARLVTVFEGQDAAGKGKRESLDSPGRFSQLGRTAR